MERGPVAINRFNGSREIRVEAETIDPLASVPDILAQIEVEIMPELEGSIRWNTLCLPGTAKIQSGGHGPGR